MKADPAVQRRIAAGLGIATLLFVAVGGWAANASLTGAVVANGQIVVDTSIKKVQHPTGGVIGELLAKNGSKVKAGDVLLRLDDTQTRANLAIVTNQLIDLSARKARLIAERDQAEAAVFPESLMSLGTKAVASAEGERKLLEAKRRTAASQKAQLGERIGQYRQEIEGLTAQEKAKSKEIKLVQEELERVEAMFKKALLPVTRLISLQREASRIEGEHGQLIAQIARAGGQISETELQITNIEQTVVTEAQKELTEVEARIAELEERKVAADDMLRRVDLRAPLDGTVHELAVGTIGGVIGPGETVMSIVPSNDDLAIEVHVSPIDIDQIHIGQKSILRFSAFNQRTTPEFKGEVARIAADLSKDQQSGMTFYVVRVKLNDESTPEASKLKLMPGMPVEAYIETTPRTALSYLTKPLTDQVERAFRED
jgi:HlyD family secretion protein